MIQRKGELILSWIGNGLHLLYVFLIGIFFIMTQTSDFKNGMIQGFIEENPGEYDLAYQTYNLMLGLGVVLIIVLLILLIVSIVAAILIGKNAKVSGILLVITGIIGLFLSFMAGVLWLIAGIMLLVRKPQTQNDQINSQYSNDIHSHVVPEEKKREQQQYNMNEPHIGQQSTSHHDHALNDQNKRENHNHDNQPYK
ncbi:DUF4064 domain-containing protein [Staphylococcus epidermidis]|uniref:DUF4064 domain-containing protein n=1 Tax=Staphylococcus epidermidis TaxID=1282 RepID=UPI002004364B|nr:DUF4064 domain-containing protein [Staphylococcus epidermidis]MCG1236723.1 DUF4064 domain-containing protein [Staphylococcus epidermidis]MCG1252392.1 DUF4064 domain-containing protein [Staphylococcus epidermidis]MCG1254618.1 DUF4064 domain-containing protein [Staphylococcus epidermidis]MCG1407218.1 DUF4064 domain-containing protein [Staphylococcus epidermidis]MCG1411899.1 DUF4064 domain-containing protein [Staphylococcus epidermidis]